MFILDLNNLSISDLKLLDELHSQLIKEYHDFIEQLYNDIEVNIDWLVNTLLSRNNHLSNVFLYFCELELVKKIIKEKELNLIIVKTRQQQFILNQYFINESKNIKIKYHYSTKYKLRSIYNIFRSLFVNIYLSFVQYNQRNIKRVKKLLEINNITIIDTFFLGTSFSGSHYNDRYYPGLIDNIDEIYANSIYFIPHFLSNKNIKKQVLNSERSDVNFIYKFDYLKFHDYLYALISPLRIKKIDFNKYFFKDFMVGPILRQEFYNNITSTSSFNGILNYRFFKRLKEKGISLRYVIDWFENQPIDRGFNKGKNDYYPEVPSVGYQGYIVALDYNFHIQSTIIEGKYGVLPDEIKVIGGRLINSIKKYNNSLIVKTAPAFRFQGVWEIDSLINGSKLKNTVLVSLPISLKESIEIIQLIMKVNTHNNNITFYIKPHPYLKIKKIKEHFFNKWPRSFVFINGDFKNAISKSLLLISNTSSTCVETIAMGKPVIIIGSRTGLTQNPIPKELNRKIWTLCYDEHDLAKALDKYINLSSKEIMSNQVIAEEVRNNYFEKITPNAVKSFLNLIN
jgi:hypothetical protein